MKKLFVVCLSIALISSCAQEEINQTNIVQKEVIVTSEDGTEPMSVIQGFVKEHPEYYVFEDSHSDLWAENTVENTNLKDAPLIASGYDYKTQISTATATYVKGLLCDNRIIAGVSYVTKKIQYKKTIQIPKGATLILPPISTMATMTPMGYVPGTSNIGYAAVYVSTNTVQDTYYLVTEGTEITHNYMGQEIAPANNPVYVPCNLRIPSNFVFKYQYAAVEW
ncbi:MAG: hypothetical protein LBU90_05720 [Bacteroidales bacterium]|jgi:hypothetical protein|nr:hypothetical protein [Bacteroidales bacterium]